MADPEEVLNFWLNEVGQAGWYKVDDALDREIRDRFMDTWQAASRDTFCTWKQNPRHALALIVLTDQFPRNMFRGEARAFATDALARKYAKCAIDRDWDLQVKEPERQFFYLPLMHSENLSDQERCVRLMMQRMPEEGDSNLLHARAHRQVIRQFGRFPYRNAALDRASTPPEMAYVADGGYGSTVTSLQAA
ncbi:DUF924 family protein [Chachezhania antarctica]|uniref:DUF924 family protein n=1 Tax=Chachezhania antarctica TaxID=2340860 RepID=UPI000EAFFE67|nr:DUF924 family protein [Chachezhania antarctica]